MPATKFIMDLARKLAAGGPPQSWSVDGDGGDGETTVVLRYELRADQAAWLHVIDEAPDK